MLFRRRTTFTILGVDSRYRPCPRSPASRTTTAVKAPASGRGAISFLIPVRLFYCYLQMFAVNYCCFAMSC